MSGTSASGNQGHPTSNDGPEEQSMSDESNTAPLQQASQDDNNAAKYLVPSKEFLTRSVPHMLDWLRRQPQTQDRSPHSVVTQPPSIHINDNGPRRLGPKELREFHWEKLNQTIQRGWNHKVSLGTHTDDSHNDRNYNRRIQTLIDDEFDMYDFVSTEIKRQGKDPEISLACVPAPNIHEKFSFTPTTTRYPCSVPPGDSPYSWPWESEDYRRRFEKSRLDTGAQHGMLCRIRPMWIDSTEGACLGMIGFDSAAIIFDVLMYKSSYGIGCSDNHRGATKDNCPHDFIAAYASPWPSNAARNWVSKKVSVGGLFYLQYHVRSSSTVPPTALQSPSVAATADETPPTGLLCERQVSVLSLLGQKFQLFERRYSLSLRIWLREPFGLHSIVALEDPVPLDLNVPYIFVPYEDVFGGQKIIEFDHYNLRVTGEQYGIAHFQYLLCRMTDYWYFDWTSTLSQIDSMITIQIHDLAVPESLQKLMYDDGSLKRSESYFSLLQLLRLFRDNINNSVQELAHFRTEICGRDCYGPFPGKDDDPAVKKNWKAILKHKKDRHDVLLKRIDRMTREVESLRDGLFNASSIKEAIKGTHINQILLVFTVVTIIYLPLTFVSTVFALSFIQSKDVTQTRNTYWIALVVISAATYLAGIVAFWKFGIIPWHTRPGSSSASQGPQLTSAVEKGGEHK